MKVYGVEIPAYVIDHAMATMDTTPGSPKASHLGCTCPVVDNHYGHGINDDGKTFWINADCPLHGVAADDEQENEE